VVAKCESQLAAALATRNADLLPVLPRLVFTPDSERCADCHGTGYSHHDLGLCYCMAGERPAYDFPRYANGEVPISTIGMSSQTPANKLEVWVPCQHCDILPTGIGPWNGHDLIRVPWVPDCAVCNDTSPPGTCRGSPAAQRVPLRRYRHHHR
jgi:hypothetical protein